MKNKKLIMILSAIIAVILCVNMPVSATDNVVKNTELNSEDTIICERARRTLDDYDVGRRVTFEDTENYYDLVDFNYMYNYITDTDCYERPFLYSVPDIKHIDYDMNYNEYWLDDTRSQKYCQQEKSLILVVLNF
ncbi:MAG: hypothetical protein K2I80_09225 [Ruminococcus sp.]|nr:hypothetical protein [Ruminococcus sp.]